MKVIDYTVKGHVANDHQTTLLGMHWDRDWIGLVVSHQELME
jgi:hypothetical protein